MGGGQSRQTGKSACVGMAQCQRLWLGGEESRQTGKVVCFGFSAVPDGMVGWAGRHAIYQGFLFGIV